MADVAAPGVGIISSIPGNQYMAVSGTSQASPFVANVVGRIMNANPSLTFEQVKEVLMQTSDMKDFLKDKVRSGGIVNPERAVKAAELALQKGVADAIFEARMMVNDVVEPVATFMGEEADDKALLPTMVRYLKAYMNEDTQCAIWFL